MHNTICISLSALRHVPESWEETGEHKGGANRKSCGFITCVTFPSSLKIKQTSKGLITPQIIASLLSSIVPPPPPALKSYGGTHFGGGVLALLELGLWRGATGWGWELGQGWAAEESPSGAHQHPWHPELRERKKETSVICGQNEPSKGSNTQQIRLSPDSFTF